MGGVPHKALYPPSRKVARAGMRARRSERTGATNGRPSSFLLELDPTGGGNSSQVPGQTRNQDLADV